MFSCECQVVLSVRGFSFFFLTSFCLFSFSGRWQADQCLCKKVKLGDEQLTCPAITSNVPHGTQVYEKLTILHSE